MQNNTDGPPEESSGKYDYIIAGAGCAGLSLAVHMIRSGKFGNKKILIVDKEEKIKNDRTWCFWETAPGPFEDIVFKKWDKVWIHGKGISKLINLRPYQYKLIRGIDFYTYCFDLVRRQKNITLYYGAIQQIIGEENETGVIVDDKKFSADYVFNSILPGKPDLKKNEYWLLQHFKGWIIETGQPVFNPSEATLMDFRVGQRQGTSFVYVMPFTESKALVEYTLFSKELLTPQQYDEELKRYLQEIAGINSYAVMEEESGVIPMTNHHFATHYNKVINIGTAGGQTKASSGYTFRFIQKHSAAITEQLIKTGEPFIAPGKKRFHFYDSTLLHILYHNKLQGKDIFTDLFVKNKPQQVLRFLDNESSLKDELKIISSLPALPFLKAALRQL
jgi:lycopene beta-cyclase